MKITTELLKAIYPASTEANRAKYAAPLERAMLRFSINTPLRAAAFLAQVGHESGQLRYVEENLNYSATGLLTTFGKYFKMSADAASYARNPEKIANRVYANRLANDDEASGDGWRYRGRGLIQLTGKVNYAAAGLGLGVDLTKDPNKLLTPEYATLSASWFWHSKGLNAIADKLGGKDDIKMFGTISVVINGGTNGKADREALYLLAKKALL